MIDRTLGIVLRVAPFSKTSHVVTWLTRDFGKLTTVVKGAQRPKSQFLGQYDLFYTCEILFYSRERAGTHILRESSIVEMRDGLRKDWKASACASYFCDLVSRASPPRAENEHLFALLNTTLAFLDESDAALPALLWFELKTAEVLGLAPRLSSCVNCHNAVDGAGRAGFSSAEGGVVCRNCVEHGGAGAISVHPIETAVLASLKQWQDASSPSEITEAQDKHLLESAKIMGDFLEYHVHLELNSRRIAIELLNG